MRRREKMINTNTKTRALCANCEKETVFERIIKKEVFDVRGEPITVDVEYTKCQECDDEVLTPTANHDPFEAAYREYRRKHTLLQPEEITGWRKSHHLSQVELAKLVGFGIATLNRYENGALQNESHERLLRLTMDSSNLFKLIEKSEGVFSATKRKVLLDELKDSGAAGCTIDETLVGQFGGDETNELNGYKRLDLEKLYNLILFLAKTGVVKTKLNKLLFYADFKHFKEFGVSITGLRYAHLPYGPVPDNYEMYYASMYSRRLIESVEDINQEGFVIETIKAIEEPNLNIFSGGELQVIASVMEYFKDHKAKEIRDFSHEEKGYKQTKNGDIISYGFAKDLNY
jgi:putative zinc finger/helix-turn-helix YgiT family protein